MKGKSMKKDELLKDIEKYWTNRAEGYSQVNLEELAGEKWPVWLSVIEEHMPKVERKRPAPGLPGKDSARNRTGVFFNYLIKSRLSGDSY